MIFGRGAKGTPRLDHDAVRLLDQAEQIAAKSGDVFATADRLLVALALAAPPRQRVRRANSSSAGESCDATEKYARDLTQAARDGKREPVIDRDEEIRRTIQTLARRTKNNHSLIEMRTLIGADASEGSMDASNLLKPALDHARRIPELRREGPGAATPLPVGL